MPWYQKHKDQQIPLHVSKQVLPVLKYGTVFHHNFPSLYHLTLVYFGQRKTCGRQGIKHKSLPTSSAPITRNAIKQYFLKEIVTKGRQIPREWYQTASHASLPYWGLLLLFGFAKHSAFWLRSSKAILHFPCFPPLTYRELFVHMKTNLHFIFCWVRIKALIIFLDPYFLMRIG